MSIEFLRQSELLFSKVKGIANDHFVVDARPIEDAGELMAGLI